MEALRFATSITSLPCAEIVYMERYCLLVRADHPLANTTSVTWADASREPLCLLTPDNQNRRIIDRAFRTAAGGAPVPRLETNSVINLCANVHMTGLVSVVPEYFLEVARADFRHPCRAAHRSARRAQRRPDRGRSGSDLSLGAGGVRMRPRHRTAGEVTASPEDAISC